jgi:hypothetical protein
VSGTARYDSIRTSREGRVRRRWPTFAGCPELRDHGTKEFCAKPEYLINGADPQLAATASGILFASGFLTHDRHAAALRYA